MYGPVWPKTKKMTNAVVVVVVVYVRRGDYYPERTLNGAMPQFGLKGKQWMPSVWQQQTTAVPIYCDTCAGTVDCSYQKGYLADSNLTQRLMPTAVPEILFFVASNLGLACPCY